MCRHIELRTTGLDYNKTVVLSQIEEFHRHPIKDQFSFKRLNFFIGLAPDLGSAIIIIIRLKKKAKLIYFDEWGDQIIFLVH
jgi:hypothetical protein